MKILSSLHDAMFRAQQNVASYYLIIIDTYFGLHILTNANIVVLY